MLHQHDRDRIDAGVMLALAHIIGAIALPATLGQHGRIAATGAIAVTGVPIDQAARRAIDGQFLMAETAHRRPQPRIGRRDRADQAGRNFGKAALAAHQAKEDKFAVRSGIGQAAPFQLPVRGDLGIEPVQPQQPGAPIHQAGQLVRVGADMIGAV